MIKVIIDMFLFKICPCIVNKRYKRQVTKRPNIRDESRNEALRLEVNLPHNFFAKSYKRFTFCDHCGFSLYGFFENGLQCKVCNLYVHKRCQDNVTNNCINNFSINDSDDFKVCADDFNFFEILGKGSYGKVMLAKEKATENVYAVKVLKKCTNTGNCGVEYTLRDKSFLTLSAKHPFLTTLHSCFQTVDRLFFVMEYVNGGSLMFHLRREKNFDEKRTAFHAAEIILALQYLHHHGVIYRGLKLENVLLDQDGHCKLTDFDMCKEEIFNGILTSTICGPRDYMAPEILQKLEYGPSVDWWALGVLIYEMMVGQPLFIADNKKDLLEQILRKTIFFPIWLSRSGVSIIQGLLEKIPARRLGCIENELPIRRHLFFRGFDWESLELHDI